MIRRPVDVVEVLKVLSRSVVFSVDFVNTTGLVTGSLTSDLTTVMLGFTVVSTLLTVFKVVFLRRFLVVRSLEMAVTVVGVTLKSPFEVVLTGVKGAVLCLVTFGDLVVRVVPFRKVVFPVRILFRLVKVVTLGVLGFLAMISVSGVVISLLGVVSNEKPVQIFNLSLSSKEKKGKRIWKYRNKWLEKS